METETFESETRAYTYQTDVLNTPAIPVAQRIRKGETVLQVKNRFGHWKNVVPTTYVLPDEKSNHPDKG